MSSLPRDLLKTHAGKHSLLILEEWMCLGWGGLESQAKDTVKYLDVYRRISLEIRNFIS